MHATFGSLSPASILPPREQLCDDVPREREVDALEKESDIPRERKVVALEKESDTMLMRRLNILKVRSSFEQVGDCLSERSWCMQLASTSRPPPANELQTGAKECSALLKKPMVGNLGIISAEALLARDNSEFLFPANSPSGPHVASSGEANSGLDGFRMLSLVDPLVLATIRGGAVSRGRRNVIGMRLD